MRKPVIGIGSDINVTPGIRDRAFVYTTYVDALRRAGAIPVLIPPQPENAAEIVRDLDGILRCARGCPFEAWKFCVGLTYLRFTGATATRRSIELAMKKRSGSRPVQPRVSPNETKHD